MHHERPLCEYGQWIIKTDSEVWLHLHWHGCRLCSNRDRGMLLNMTAQRYSFMQARENGRNAGNHDGLYPLGAYLGKMAHLNITVHGGDRTEVVPYGSGEMLLDTKLAMETGPYAEATDEQKWDALRKLPKLGDR